MNAATKQAPAPAPGTKRKEKKLHVRLEVSLAERLRVAADRASISPSDKVRRILDAALPPTP